MAAKEYDLVIGHLTLDGVHYVAPCRVTLSDEDAKTMLASGVVQEIAAPAKASKSIAPK